MPNAAATAAPLSIEDQGRILTFVRCVNLEGVDWQAAQERLRQLQAAVPSAAMELVADRENIGGDVTYCLLMTHGDAVYSLSCSRQGVLPWQLRGATNAEANDLLTVNGHRVTVEDAVHLLDFIWGTSDVATRMIDTALLAREVGRASGNLSAEELAGVLEQFYSERNLQTVEARTDWLAGKGLTETRLERLLEEAIQRRRLERTLVDARFEEEWRDRAHDYAAFRVMQATVPQDSVREAERLLREHPQGRNISTVVSELSKAIAHRHPLRIELAELMRHELGSSAGDVFGQPEGRVLLVLMPTGETRLIEIVAHEPEVSGTDLERRIVRRLMAEWYETARREARVEWHWGRSA